MMIEVIGDLLQVSTVFIILFTYYQMLRAKPFINWYVLSIICLFLFVCFFVAVYIHAADTMPLEDSVRNKCYRIIIALSYDVFTGFSAIFTSIIAIYHFWKKEKRFIWGEIFFTFLILTSLTYFVSDEYLDIDYLVQHVGEY